MVASILHITHRNHLYSKILDPLGYWLVPLPGTTARRLWLALPGRTATTGWLGSFACLPAGLQYDVHVHYYQDGQGTTWRAWGFLRRKNITCRVTQRQQLGQGCSATLHTVSALCSKGGFHGSKVVQQFDGLLAQLATFVLRLRIILSPGQSGRGEIVRPMLVGYADA
jgi:hypothetical protein